MSRTINLPLATVVIPTRWARGAELLDECLASLMRHHEHMRAGLEVFVVYDGVSDHEDELGLEATRRACEEHPDVRVLVNERGSGFARACNLGIENGSGAYTFLVNNDIVFTAPTIHELAVFGMASGVGTIAPALAYPNGRTQFAGTFFVPHPHGPDDSLPGYFDHVARNQPRLAPDVMRIGPSLLTGALMGISRGAIGRVGLLDESYGFACEDVDYCLMAMEAGMQSMFYGLACATHLEGATRGRTPEEKARYAPHVAEQEGRSMARLFEKWVNVDWNQFAVSPKEK
jgi:GT2 family glycosyltransferase